MSQGNERPAFEIRAGSKTYRIFVDGHVEGFDPIPGEPFIIINRIPNLIAWARADERVRQCVKGAKSWGYLRGLFRST